MKNVKELLAEGWVHVEFTKKDGTLRKMLCTRNMDNVPADQHPTGTGPANKGNAIRVWSLEDNGWRSFNEEQVTLYVKAIISSQLLDDIKEMRNNGGQFNALAGSCDV